MCTSIKLNSSTVYFGNATVVKNYSKLKEICKRKSLTPQSVNLIRNQEFMNKLKNCQKLSSDYNFRKLALSDEESKKAIYFNLYTEKLTKYQHGTLSNPVCMEDTGSNLMWLYIAVSIFVAILVLIGIVTCCLMWVSLLID